MTTNMKALSVMAAVVTLASAKNLVLKGTSGPWDYGTCEGDSELLNFNYFTIEPFPLVVVTDAEIKTALGFDLFEIIPKGARVKLDIQKTGVVDISLPCFPTIGLLTSW